MPRSRVRRTILALARALVYLTAAFLVLLGSVALLIQTDWTKDYLRSWLVRQANRYLSGTLEVDRLEGALLRGIQLGGVRLSKDGETLVSVDEISVSYSIRELIDRGAFIQELRLVRPHVVAAKEADGRWNLASLIRRDAREGRRTGPSVPITIRSIQVVDGDIEIKDPIAFGAVHVPSRYENLQASLSLAYEPVKLGISLANVSWSGGSSDLTMNRLSGGISSDADGLTFDDLRINTPRSAFTVSGRTIRGDAPTILDLHVSAERFSFPEWGPVVRALGSIVIDASFDADLEGPLAKLATDLTFRSNGGAIQGRFVLDTTVPGWHGAGSVRVTRFNLNPWLNRRDRASDISGLATFDLALELGRGFPRGSYRFEGPHTAFMDYEADDVKATGVVTADQVTIQEASAAAYGAAVSLSDGSIGVHSPFPFRFIGTATGVNLQLLPVEIPVPHVDSTLTFDYDASGSFVNPFITGTAQFGDSVFVGAAVEAGTVGSINTAVTPLEYSGEGDISGVDVHRFGAALGIEWMQNLRYQGTLSGHFSAQGSGTSAESMRLDATGRVGDARFFGGTLSDGDVSLTIADGSLEASYDGHLAGIDPALAVDDSRFQASLTGEGRMAVTVRDLLVRTPELRDYRVSGHVELNQSTLRDVAVDRVSVDAALEDSVLNVASFGLAGPAIEGRGSGSLSLDSTHDSQFDYEIVRGDLSLLKQLANQDAAGHVATTGRLTGPFGAMRVEGQATVTDLATEGVRALSTSGHYDALLSSGGLDAVTAEVTGDATFVEAFDQKFPRVMGTASLTKGRLTVDLQGTREGGANGRIQGEAILHAEQRTVDLLDLHVTLASAGWRLVPATPPPTVSWDEGGVALGSMQFAQDADQAQRIGVSGTWRADGAGALRVTAKDVVLETLNPSDAPAVYGGRLDLDAIVSGTSDRPIVTGNAVIRDGRIRRLAFEQFSGHVEYVQDSLRVDVRLDQAPGIWLTANGLVPLALFDRQFPDAPIELALASSSIDLGLVETVTDAVRDVSGEVQLNVVVAGTSSDPHFIGTVDIAGAAFLVNQTGAQYHNGTAHLDLSRDRVTVERFHLEDVNRRALEVRGSLGTHELQIGDLQIDIVASGFQVLRNELGQIDVDAALRLRGQFEHPSVEGRVTVVGGALNVDTILDRTLLRPYATQATPNPDAVNVLNPWQRLEVNVELHVPGTLRMVGEDVQVQTGTPLGLGSFNLRVIGDLYVYKGSAQPLYVTGSFDSLTGSYAFQGRRFEIEPTSSINFRGDLNPEVYVTVTRVISSVETRITIAGPLSEPELRFASNPPLESSDILSLIVFGTSMNQLSLAQQQELAVRAGTLAAGFITTPLVNALERSLGLDILEIEAPQYGTSGTRVTIGDEIAPGLVARFSRQFGQDQYDEATLEYYLSRILRIRATFSDARALASSPFRRIERAGVDLLFLFSF